MLSITCKTAIKATIYLASKLDSGQNASIREIAEYINASEHTVAKMLQTLVKEDIIKSIKGPSGGFYITASQTNLSVLKIVLAIDGENRFNECGLGLSKCSSTHSCPIHNDYKLVRDAFKKICSDNKIADLSVPFNEGVAFLMG